MPGIEDKKNKRQQRIFTKSEELFLKKGFSKTSMRDIAEKVGVSTALVSYVLNGLEKEKRVGCKRYSSH